MFGRPILLGVTAISTAGLLLAGFSSTSSSEPSQTAPATEQAFGSATQATFQAVLDTVRTKFNYPGAQAGIWSPDGTRVGVTGTKGVGSTEPPARDDHTRIGSLTKPFTVAVILQLAEQGKVALDDPIGKYTPGMANSQTATLRMLSNMTSGIPSYTFDEEFLKGFGSDPQRVFTPQELIDYVKGKPASFQAGTEGEYSNTNTVLLGMVIEKVTGKPFADSLKSGITEPLGLTQTSFPAGSPDLPEPYLSGTTKQGEPEGTVKNATNWNPSWGFTAGAMISTLDDLHKWGVALGSGEGVLNTESQLEREASKVSRAKGNSPTSTYALGFGVKNGWMGHTGTLPGYNTDVNCDPQDQDHCGRHGQQRYPAR
ncbi:MAG: serine hydrolase domain-containing protein [Candidatus Nanopelagicales bacterium]